MIKPILFNTDMVKAILEGRKRVTRRVIKQKYNNTHIEWKNDKFGQQIIELQNEEEGVTNIGGVQKVLGFRYIKPPYRKGDILYVRETWAEMCTLIPKLGEYDQSILYKATYKPNPDYDVPKIKWKSSIFMPKEAARIFLRVTNVSVAKLQDITTKNMQEEGLTSMAVFAGDKEIARQEWALLWNSTIPGKDYNKYCFSANPWVWVIEFERIDKPNV